MENASSHLVTRVIGFFLCQANLYFQSNHESLKERVEILNEQSSGKKVIDRNIAFVLGFVCIILGVGLVGAIAICQPSGNDALITSLQNQISTKNAQIQSLTSQKNELLAICDLAKSAVVVNETVNISEGMESVFIGETNYAGYLEVSFQTASATDTFARVVYSSHGVSYDNEVDVVSGGRAVFPIIPSNSIEIHVGTHQMVASSITLTVTLYY